MKYHSALSVMKYSWDQVASCFWNRYPNPYSKHVLSEDIVDRSVQGHTLLTKRFITKTNPIPKWGEIFVGSKRHVCIIEESEIDAKNKTITTYSRNIGYEKVMVVEEKCVYKKNPEDKKTTLIERQAWVTSDLYGFVRAIEAFGIERYKKNINKSSKGLEYVIQKMYMPDMIPDHHMLNTEKIKDTARKATELAKARARPVVANCQGSPPA